MILGQEETFRPVCCTRCGNTNSPASKFCTKCGFAFSSEVAIQAEGENRKQSEFLAQFMKDPEVRELLLRKMMECGGVTGMK